MEERIIALTGCDAVACGKNEVCKMAEGMGPVCQCEELFVWNPVTSSCEKPSLPECTKNSDCHAADACLPDDLGVLKCKPVCSEYDCPHNSICVAKNHQGECECLPGFSGHVNDRYGCRSEQQSECSSNAQCSESEMCIKQQGIAKCVAACSSIKCGENARCITNNHIAQCQCIKGGFVGDPYDLSKGCEKVPCVFNEDCPPTQSCNRMTHQCFDVCQPDSCGDNAVCFVRNRASVCQCPENFRPNPLPDIECVPDKVCSSTSCHATAVCEMGADGPLCKCPLGYEGDPYKNGCVSQLDLECKKASDCINGHICKNNRCVNPCDNYKCGLNAVCKVSSKGEAECKCPEPLIPAKQRVEDGCIRSIDVCTSDKECEGGICDQRRCKSVCRSQQDCYNGEKCIDNMCEAFCINNNQCGSGQACMNGFCQIGCRSNKDCKSDEACLDNRCQNPCDNLPVCGPNALCTVQNHKTTCTCPSFFEPNPTPDQGCVRVPPKCLANKDCPTSYQCLGNKCNFLCQNNSNICAIGERCIQNICSKVCYTSNNCLPGEICSDGVCISGCSSDVDCPHTEICVQSKCKCAKGFTPSTNGCMDIDECNENPCHPTAACENTPGSYRCTCTAKMVGDPYGGSGCYKSNSCENNDMCPENSLCQDSKCIDPCSLKTCASNAICEVDNHIPGKF
jgi:Calcium-binding EGF domain